MKKDRTRLPQLLLLLYGAVLLGFSVPFLLDRSFWLDEIYTWELIGQSWRDMILGTAADVHPPLYYCIVKTFCALFGYREPVLRLASFLPAVILVLVAAFGFQPRFGTLPAAYFITCLALMPYAMRTNAEARMYSWAFLFVTLCGYALYLILHLGRRRDWVLFTAMGGMMALVLLDVFFTLRSELVSNAFEVFKLVTVTVLGYIFGANQARGTDD